MKYMKYLKEDVRVRKLMLEKGTLSKDEVSKQLDALIDEEKLLETVKLD